MLIWLSAGLKLVNSAWVIWRRRDIVVVLRVKRLSTIAHWNRLIDWSVFSDWLGIWNIAILRVLLIEIWVHLRIKLRLGLELGLSLLWKNTRRKINNDLEATLWVLLKRNLNIRIIRIDPLLLLLGISIRDPHLNVVARGRRILLHR